MNDRFRLDRHPVIGFTIHDADSDRNAAIAEVDDPAVAQRIVRLLNEEERFLSQEPPPGMSVARAAE